jgi:hypothetical protein
MKIYQLEIKYMEEEIITEKSVYWTHELGYFTDFSLIKNIITDEVKQITGDGDEWIISIYCNVITPNKLWDTGSNETIYFNENGDIIFTQNYDVYPQKIDTHITYKIGDIIAIPNSNKGFNIGIVADLPDLEGSYYIILYDNELEKVKIPNFMEHTHEISQEMHKAQPTKEISTYLRTKLKGIISDSEYQKLFREEKLVNILKK